MKPLIFGALLAVLCVAGPLRAQEQSDADRLFEEAQQARDDGRLAEACALYGESDAREHDDWVRFEHAMCLEELGDRAAAAAIYEQIAAGGGEKAGQARIRAEELGSAGSLREPLPVLTPVAPTLENDRPQQPQHYVFSDFVDTRLTWTIGDDDVLHPTGQTVPLSPNISIGDRRRYRLFFDNLNSVFAGRENITHLVLYKKMPGFIDRLETEASMVLRFDLAALAAGSNDLGRSLYDSGSFIRLFYRLGDREDSTTGVGLTLFPIDTDRVRLGYLYDITWGGTNPRINQSIFPRIQGSSPGFKLQLSHDLFYVYGAMKTAQIVQVEEILTPGTSEVETIRIGETNLGFLGGAGAHLGDYVDLDVGGGYFQQGKFDLPDVLGEQVYTFGVSGRATVHDAKSSAGQSIDLTLYRNDPMKADRLLAPIVYDDDVSWSLAVEFNNLFQNLKDFDQPGETTLQQARAGAAVGTVRWAYWRVSLAGIYRDLPYVLRNVPSFVPFETLPSEANVGDEFFVALATDYHFDGPKLTPNIGLGVQFPATFETSSVDAGGGTIGRTVVVRQQGDVSILPVNAEPTPIFQARAGLRWDISPMLSTTGWLQVIRDNNATFVERDPNEGTVALREFVKPTFFGFGMAFAARF